MNLMRKVSLLVILILALNNCYSIDITINPSEIDITDSFPTFEIMFTNLSPDHEYRIGVIFPTLPAEYTGINNLVVELIAEDSTVQDFTGKCYLFVGQYAILCQGQGNHQITGPNKLRISFDTQRDTEQPEETETWEFEITESADVPVVSTKHVDLLIIYPKATIIYPEEGAEINGLSEVTASIDQGNIGKLYFEYSGTSTPNPGTWISIGDMIVVPPPSDITMTWDVSSIDNGNYIVRARACDTEELFCHINPEFHTITVNNQTTSSLLEITQMEPPEGEVITTGSFLIGASYTSSETLNQTKTRFYIEYPKEGTLDHTGDLVYPTDSNTVEYSASDLENGDYEITLYLENDGGGNDQKTWNFTVNYESQPANQPPVFDDFDLGNFEYPQTKEKYLNDLVQDENTDSLQYSIVRQHGLNCAMAGQYISCSATSGFDGPAWCDVLVEDANGLTDEGTISANITQPSGELLVELSASPKTGNVPLTVDFQTTVLGGEEPYTYDWDFDGDGIYDKTGNSESWIRHTYSDPGNYTAKVLVNDSWDRSKTASILITVNEKINNAPEIISLTYTPDDVDEGTLVTFKAYATDPDNDTLTYLWEFGDTSIGSGSEATHSYTLPDAGMSSKIYEIILTVTDSRGATDTDTATITVERSFLKIIIDKPLSRENRRLTKQGQVEIVLRVTDHLNSPVSESYLTGPIVEVDGQRIVLSKEGEGLYKGLFNPSYQTPNESYLYAEVKAVINDSSYSAATAKNIYFEPVEMNAEYEIDPKKLVIGELLKSIVLKARYPDGRDVLGATIKGIVKAGTTKNIQASALGEGEYFAKIDYIIQKTDESIEITLDGGDQFGNILEKRITAEVSELNPLFNIEIASPDPDKPTLFHYGREVRIAVKVNSTKKDELKSISLSLSNNEMEIYSEMKHNTEKQVYEAYITIPESSVIGKDNLSFRVSATGILYGEEYEDFAVIEAVLAEPSIAQDLMPVFALIIVLFIIFSGAYFISSALKEKQRIRNELMVERKNLSGMEKRLKYEFYKRHISEEEYKKSVLEAQQKLVTIEELLGIEKKEKLTEAQKKKAEAEKEKIMREIKEKVRGLGKEQEEKKSTKSREFFSKITKFFGDLKIKKGAYLKFSSQEEEEQVKKIIEVIGLDDTKHTKEEVRQILEKRGYSRNVIRKVMIKLFGR